MEEISNFVKSQKFKNLPKKEKYMYVNKWVKEGVPKKQLAKILWEITRKILVICASPDNHQEKIIVNTIVDMLYPTELNGEKSFYIMNDHPYMRNNNSKPWIVEDSYIRGYLGDKNMTSSLKEKGPFDVIIFLHCPIYQENISKDLFSNKEETLKYQLGVSLKPDSYVVMYPTLKGRDNEDIVLGNAKLKDLLPQYYSNSILETDPKNILSFYRSEKTKIN